MNENDRDHWPSGLEPSQDLFSALTEMTDAAISIVVDRKYRYVNPAFIQQSGYSREELSRMDFFEIIHPDQRELVRERYETRLRNGLTTPARYELRVVTRSGEYRWVDLSSNLIRFEGGPAVLTYALNIDARKKIEESLRQSEDLYRRLVDLSPEAIVVHSGGQVVLINPSGARLFGAASPEELIGRPIMDQVHPDHRKKVTERIRQMITSGRDVPPLQEKFLRLDGSTFDVEVTPAPIVYQGRPAVLVVARDITESKQAETARRASAVLYRSTIDAIDSLIHVIDRDFHVTLMNAALATWADRLGLEHRTWPEHTLFEVFPFLPENVRAEYEQVFRTGQILVTEEITALGDREVITETKKIPIMEGESVAKVVTVVTDITEKKKAEARLTESEAKYRLLFEKSNDAFFLIGPDSSILDCNRQVERLLQRDRSEIIGHDLLDFVSPAHHDDSRKKMVLLTAGINPGRYEKEFIGRDGQEIPVEISPTPVMDEAGKLRWIYSVVRDISERRQAERLQSALFRISETTSSSKDIQELYRAIHRIVGELMNANNFYIAVYDPRTQLLSFPCFVDEFDAPPLPRPTGHGLTEYVLRTREPLLASSATIAQLETQGEVKALGTDAVDWLGVPLKSAAGDPFGVLVVQSYREEVRYTEKEKNILMFVSQQIATAIERKQTEEMLRETDAQFQHLQKIETIGTLVGSIAHDYNNLLTAILGNAQLLRLTLQGREPGLTRYLEAIIRATESGAGLVQQLLAFTKKEKSQPEILNLNKIVTDWQEILQRVVGERIQVSFNLSAGLNPVQGDLGKIRQVLMNLVTNARDAMPAGGVIAVATANESIPEPRVLWDQTIRPGEYACLTVRDTGEGMSPQTLTEIFNPFFTTKDKGKGTGLGLSIVKRIADQLNGYITVDSRLGQGTAMTLYLPFYEQTAAGDESPVRTVLRRGEGQTVLVVEDDPAVQEMLTRVLQDHLGYRTFAAYNGREAVGILEKQPIELVITDLRMPEMDGWALAAHIASRHPHLRNRIVAITAYLETFGLTEKPFTFAKVLRKPIQIEELSLIIHQLLHPERSSSDR